MKHFVALAFTCLAYRSAQSAEVACLTIGPGVTLVTTTAQKSAPQTRAPITRKKHHASTIFQGLAQSCQHLGTAVAAENKKEKQQAAINILGTMFNVAAQLAAPSTPQQSTAPQANQTPQQASQQPQQVQPASLAPAFTKLTTALLAEFETLPVKADISLFPILATFKSLKTVQEQESFIQTILSLPTGAKEYLNEIFAALQAYLQINVSEMMDYVKEYLFFLLDQLGTQSAESQPEQETQEDQPQLNQFSI